MIQNIINAILILGMLFLIIWGLPQIEKKRSVYECHTWQTYAETYRNWYATNAERSQCAYYNIELPADKVE